MANEQTHISYSAQDIEQYHRGNLSPAAMHALEKAALDDPFLADALEGYSQDPRATESLAQLQSRLQERITGKELKRIGFAWWKAAAAALLLLTGGWIYFLNREHNGNPVAKTNEPIPITAPGTVADSVNPRAATAAVPKATADSITEPAINAVAANNRPAARHIPAQKKSSTQGRRAEADKLTGGNEAYSSNAFKPPAAPEKDSTTEDHTEALNAIAKEAPVRAERRALAFDQTNPDKIKKDTVNYYSPGYTRADQGIAGNTEKRRFSSFSGIIVDPNSKPLANATVQLPGLHFSTTTDQRGYFSFRAKDTAVHALISMPGYESQDAGLFNNSIENPHNIIFLKPSLLGLNETSLTGNLNKRKRDSLARISDSLIRHQAVEPVNGWTAYFDYLHNHKTVPPGMQDIHGDVIVSFMVDRKNRLSGMAIQQSLVEELDSVALKLVEKGPAFKVLQGKKATGKVKVTF